MERKTKVHADEGGQDLTITREFDLPVELLFRAYEDPEIVAQWMNTKVVKLESKTHGAWRFETSDGAGNVVFQAHGVYHEFTPGERIIRTFEIEDAPFGVQLETLQFQALTDDTSKLTMQIVYKSPDLRNQMLQMPFAHGLNMAHNRLQEIASNFK